MIKIDLFCLATWIMGILFFYLPFSVFEQNINISTSSGSTMNATALVFGTILALGLVYFFRYSKWFGTLISLMMGLMIFTTLNIFTQPITALSITLLLVYLERAYRSFLTNNLYVLLAVFAGAMPLAVFYKTDFIGVLLVLFSLYDLVGVLMVKIIPRIAQAALERDMPLLLAIPKKPIKWTHKPTLKTSVTLLGAGDIFLPLIFLTAVSVQIGRPQAFLCLFGAFLGNIANMIFLHKTKKSVPAMPLLAIGMLLMYFFVQ